MKVQALIEALQKMPQDADVTHLWDGEPRTNIEIVYLARGGFVVTSDFEMVCYSNESRPADAPTAKDDPYWETPNMILTNSGADDQRQLDYESGGEDNG